MLIEISPQPRENSPFVLRRIVDCDGDTINAVAIPVRNGDRTDWDSVERIQTDMRVGRFGPSVPMQSSSSNAESAEQVLREIEGQQNWQDAPVFWLQAFPTGPSGAPEHIERFFGRDGVATRLQTFQPLRYNGFNLTVFGQPDYVDGNVVYGSRDDAYLRLDSTGVFTLAILAIPRVIGWGVGLNPDLEFDQPVVVNGTVILEETVEFCRFVHTVLKPELNSAEWKLRLTCERFKRYDIRLASGLPRLYMQLALTTSHRSSSNHWVRDVRLETSVASDAYKVATRFYALFNLGPDSIPLTTGEEIDVDAFLTLSG